MQDRPCFKCGDLLCDGTKCKLGTPIIIQHDGQMTNVEMIEEAKKVLVQAIKEKPTLYDASVMIREHFNKKYGEDWVCIIGQSNVSDSSLMF